MNNYLEKKKVKVLLLSLQLLLVVSCSSPQEETVNYSDLAPTSDKYNKRDVDAAVDHLVKNERPETSVFLSLVDTLLFDSRWTKWDTVLFPDRFGPSSQEKWMTIGEKDSLVLLHYQFKDSLRTKNAFFNWIDCFGPKCKSYVIGANVRIPKRAALWLIGNKDLIVIEGNKSVDEELMRSLITKDSKKENWLYVVSIPKTGKTTWKRIDKGIEKPIPKADEISE